MWPRAAGKRSQLFMFSIISKLNLPSAEPKPGTWGWVWGCYVCFPIRETT